MDRIRLSLSNERTQTLAWARSLMICSLVQVVSIAVLTNMTGAGGFFPDGLNGVINGESLTRFRQTVSMLTVSTHACLLFLTMPSATLVRDNFGNEVWCEIARSLFAIWSPAIVCSSKWWSCQPAYVRNTPFQRTADVLG